MPYVDYPVDPDGLDYLLDRDESVTEPLIDPIFDPEPA